MGELRDTVDAASRSVGARLDDFAWELLQELQQVRDELREINRTLKSPNRTRADESRLSAEEARRRGALQDADRLFLRALGDDPLDGRTYIGLALTYIKQGRFADAEKILSRGRLHIAQITELEVFRLRLTGRLAACRGDLVEARSITAKARGVRGADVGLLLYEEALYAAQMGDVKATVELLKAAVDTNPGYAELSKREHCLSSVRDIVKREVWDSMACVDFGDLGYKAAQREFWGIAEQLPSLHDWDRRGGELRPCFKAEKKARDMMPLGKWTDPVAQGRWALQAVAAMHHAVELVRAEVAEVARYEDSQLRLESKDTPARLEKRSGFWKRISDWLGWGFPQGPGSGSEN
jgi:tetratricopeptide (TPR) repeat protein